MNKIERAVITIVGKDRVGILAGAASEVADAKGNVINVNQTVMDGFFTMTMIIDITDLALSLDELQKRIEERFPDMTTHVMHENIFSAMHTI